MFKIKEVCCTICGKEIEGGEDIVVFMNFPKRLAMPAGSLSSILANKAREVYC
ncbi:hypothetical protein [Brevibacillus choshinensis]|uniref:hypothetical protein n=2 Tax=Brevibacillus choshinensis TaxID=54911 RepID=UPI002E1A7775|nr:hypothetical protein [Brevibacillus choshinensis]